MNLFQDTAGCLRMFLIYTGYGRILKIRMYVYCITPSRRLRAVASLCVVSRRNTHARTHARTQHFLHFHICVREGSDQPVHPSDQNLHWPHKEALRSLAILWAPMISLLGCRKFRVSTSAESKKRGNNLLYQPDQVISNNRPS